ncbi:hypothetical protein ACU1JV_03435 [Paenibacillus sp. T2-29]|uniref:hypothetical protein n=1 Tax=Paenibacillus TaxID=44249 RepID=UPI0039BC782C
MQSDKEASISIRSYMAEMHNDALYYLSQANGTTDLFPRYRFFRSSLINFCTSAEAAMSTIVYNHLKSNELTLSDDDKKLLDKLNDPQSIPPFSFRSIANKIKTIERLFNMIIPDEVKSSYVELTETRNKIIHYSSSYKEIIYENGTIEAKAKEAPQIVDDFLSVLFSLVGLSGGFYKNRKPNY